MSSCMKGQHMLTGAGWRSGTGAPYQWKDTDATTLSPRQPIANNSTSTTWLHVGPIVHTIRLGDASGALQRRCTTFKIDLKSFAPWGRLVMHVLDLEFVYCRVEMDRASVTRACASRGGIEGGGFSIPPRRRGRVLLYRRELLRLYLRESARSAVGAAVMDRNRAASRRGGRESRLFTGWEQGGEGVVRNERNDDD